MLCALKTYCKPSVLLQNTRCGIKSAIRSCSALSERHGPVTSSRVVKSGSCPCPRGNPCPHDPPAILSTRYAAFHLITLTGARAQCDHNAHCAHLQFTDTYGNIDSFITFSNSSQLFNSILPGFRFVDSYLLGYTSSSSQFLYGLRRFSVSKLWKRLLSRVLVLRLL